MEEKRVKSKEDSQNSKFRVSANTQSAKKVVSADNDAINRGIFWKSKSCINGTE